MSSFITSSHHSGLITTLYAALVILLLGSELAVSIFLKKAGPFLSLVLLVSFVVGRSGIRPSRHLLLFAIPASGALPALILTKHPFNYIPTLMMIIAGLALARPQSIRSTSLNRSFPRYVLWLLITVTGSLFLIMRWSTLGEGAVQLFPNLLSSPAGDRLSFTILFPVLTLCLYGIAPLMIGLKKELDITVDNSFPPLVSGFFASAFLAALQGLFKLPLLSRPAWINSGHSNGASSDFNGLGLISGFMFFYALIRLSSNNAPRSQRISAAIALPVSLLCAWWSQSRTALLIIFVAAIWFVFSQRTRLFAKTYRRAWLVLLLLAATSLSLPRIHRPFLKALTVQSGQTWLQHIDRLSNGRLTMLTDSGDTIIRYPVSGIGPGNYLFYQRYKHFNSSFLHDLPLNQFLLILLEGGLLSLGLFLFWLFGWFRHSHPPWTWLMGAFCLSFLVGTPLWLPEGMVLFWLIIALGRNESEAPKARKTSGLVTAMALFITFVAFNLMQFKSLDPSTWQNELKALNSYGFWNADPGMEQVFRWSRRHSGYYITKSMPQAPRIYCGAPLPHLPGRKQTVQVFWQGKPLEKLIFTENNSQTIILPQGQAGWLEFLVEPVFNLKDMNLGPETRTLGVQLHFQ